MTTMELTLRNSRLLGDVVAEVSAYPTKAITNALEEFLSKIKELKVKDASFADRVSPSGDEWWNVPENVAMVNEGRKQLNSGKGVVLTRDDLMKRLGL